MFYPGNNLEEKEEEEEEVLNLYKEYSRHILSLTNRTQGERNEKESVSISQTHKSSFY